MNPLPLRLVRLEQLAARREVDARPAAVFRRTGHDPGGAGDARGRGGVGDGRGHPAKGGRLSGELLYAEIYEILAYLFFASP